MKLKVPGVYTNVGHYKKWIREHMEPTETQPGCPLEEHSDNKKPLENKEFSNSSKINHASMISGWDFNKIGVYSVIGICKILTMISIGLFILMLVYH